MDTDLLNLEYIEHILKKYKLKPAKKFGQNFVLDKKAVQDMVDASNISEKGLVVEIGPGLGALTKYLSAKCKKVIAIEKDANMIRILKETLVGCDNTEVIKADALKYKWDEIPEPYKVVANIPYYITAPIIRVLLESSNPPSSISLMVQKEVAERICATPPHLNILAIAVQYYASPKIIRIVEKSSFYPIPKVDSAILHIKVDTKREGNSQFFKIIKAGFSSPRKTLLNNLSNNLKLSKSDIEAKLNSLKLDKLVRPENLSIEQWEMLIKSLEL